MKQLTGIALGFVLSGPVAAGDIYRWVDDLGQVHFGDRPPALTPAASQPLRPSGADAADESGLRTGERTRLREIEQRESHEAADRAARGKQAAADEKRRARQADQDAQRCAGYRRKINEYRRRLRAGCRVSTCNTYETRIDSYQDKAARVCR
jgi:hypothetical protein